MAITLFLSYAREDRRAVEGLYARLRDCGFTPWMDSYDISPGEDWERSIWRAIRRADFFVFCLSSNSVEKRGFLQKELKEALEIWKEKLQDDIYLIPVRLDECQIPRPIMPLQCVDLFVPDGFRKLEKAVREGMNRREPLAEGEELDQKTVKLSLREEDEENRYSYSAEYPQVLPENSPAIVEVNRYTAAFVTDMVRRFAAESKAFAEEKREMHKKGTVTAWDDLCISSRVELLSEHFFSVHLEISSYRAGAVHPNSVSRTLNFRLRPPLRLELTDLFKPSSGYLAVLSMYCISELDAQAQGVRTLGSKDLVKDRWIIEGAGPEHKNFERFLLAKGGILIVFDPYQVGSYSEGRHEVLVPTAVLKDVLAEEFADL